MFFIMNNFTPPPHLAARSSPYLHYVRLKQSTPILGGASTFHQPEKTFFQRTFHKLPGREHEASAVPRKALHSTD